MNKNRKIIFITGCSSGFGYYTALKFAKNGYQVFAGVRDINSLGAKELKKISTEEDLLIQILALDVQKDEQVHQAISDIMQKTGHIDVLVNNAGYGCLGPIEDFEIEDIKDLYETNIFGVIRITKAILPIMRKQKSGMIINVSSINGIVPFPLFSIYSTTKFAIETLTEGLRFEVGHFGIKVVLVEPGSYGTNFSKRRFEPRNLRHPESPYKQLVSNFFNRYTQTHKANDTSIHSKTADPSQVAEKIYQIAQDPNPKLRYLIGFDAIKFYWLRKILPYAVWEWLLHKTYKW